VHELARDAGLPTTFKGLDGVELELTAVKQLRTEAAQQARYGRAAEALPSGSRKLLSKDDGRVDVPVYNLNQMKTGDYGTGPAIIEEDFFTCRVLDGWSFVISDAGDILLNKKGN
jgi:N-methylhydantoinase A